MMLNIKKYTDANLTNTIILHKNANKFVIYSTIHNVI